MRRRLGRRLVGVALVGGGALGLSACSSQSAGLARQACAQVDASLRLYGRAQHATGAAQVRLLQRANVDLREALPNAALAASSDTDFQALAATLSESSRVPESDLTGALRAQCANLAGA